MKYNSEEPIWKAYIEKELCQEEQDRVEKTAQEDAAYGNKFEEYKKLYQSEKLYWKKQIKNRRRKQRASKWLITLLLFMISSSLKIV